MMKLMSSQASIRKSGSGKYARYEIVLTDRYMDSFGQISKQNKVWFDYSTLALAKQDFPNQKRQMRALGHNV